MVASVTSINQARSILRRRATVQPGEQVEFKGTPHEVFKVQGDWVGLIDLSLPRLFDGGKEDRPLAHFAVKKDDPGFG